MLGQGLKRDIVAGDEESHDGGGRERGHEQEAQDGNRSALGIFAIDGRLSAIALYG